MTIADKTDREEGDSLNASRRDFLRTSAGAVLGASLIRASETGAAAANPIGSTGTATDTAGEIYQPISVPRPPHKSLLLPGVHGYGQKSLVAGETLQVRMSADTPYRMTIRRLGVEVDDRTSDKVLLSTDVANPRVQPIYPGSYIHVSKGLNHERPLQSLSLECWLRPWALDRRQGIITQMDDSEPGGVGLLLAPRGQLEFHCGEDARTKEACVLRATFPKERVWHHVAATWDGRNAQIFIDGKRLAEKEFDASVTPREGPIRLGASGVKGEAAQFLDGDLAAQAVYLLALSDALVQERYKAAGRTRPHNDGLAGFWPLNEERGAFVKDVTGEGRHGQVINRGTWMIGGPGFDAASVPRYGKYDPNADLLRGHGLRFASDDLYDCGWEVDHEFDIPADAAPGIYIADAEFERKGNTYHYPLTFVVRRSPRQRAANMLVLCATSTWTAYSSTPFPVNTDRPLMWGTDGIKNCHGDAPAYSCYRNHRAGQPTYKIGLNMPWPAAGPDVRYSPPEVGYSHLMRAERYLLAWLEKSGYKFDVATDLDLHRQPELLNGRKVVVMNGHSEYWSREAYQAVDNYLVRDGSLVVLSGNTMFWRTTFDDEVMECRKFDDHIGGRPNALVGELYHEHDHRRGGLMRECGLPAWRVVGLDAAGWGQVEKIGGFAPYTVTDADHPIFTTPTPTNVRNGDTFGRAPDEAGPRAVGHEWDIRLSRLIKMTGQLPAGVELTDEPTGIRTLALGRPEGVTALDYLGRAAKLVDDVGAEMIDWQRPTGGRVINFGSIGVGWALAVDPKLQTVMHNALHACGITKSSSSDARGA